MARTCATVHARDIILKPWVNAAGTSGRNVQRGPLIPLHESGITSAPELICISLRDLWHVNTTTSILWRGANDVASR